MTTDHEQAPDAGVTPPGLLWPDFTALAAKLQKQVAQVESIANLARKKLEGERVAVQAESEMIDCYLKMGTINHDKAVLVKRWLSRRLEEAEKLARSYEEPLEEGRAALNKVIEAGSLTKTLVETCNKLAELLKIAD